MPASFPVSLLLLPGFSLLSLGAVRSVFAAANEQLGEPLFQLRQYVVDGTSVHTQCGMEVAGEPLVALEHAGQGLILVLANELVDGLVADTAGRRLRALAERPECVLGAIGTAAHILAGQGLLDGYRTAIHWQILPDAVQRFPGTIFSPGLYEIDRDRISSGAGLAVLDLLLTWLATRHGGGFAAELAAGLGLDRLRGGDERQPLPASAQPAVGSARLKEALELMEANLAEPLQTEDISRLVGVSRRQLERLFRQHMDTLPSRYYHELRLKHARRQLRQTTQSILQVGLACGFTSGPHFSTAYRNHFGYTPREERARRMMPPTAPQVPGEDTT